MSVLYTCDLCNKTTEGKITSIRIGLGIKAKWKPASPGWTTVAMYQRADRDEDRWHKFDFCSKKCEAEGVAELRKRGLQMSIVERPETGDAIS